MAEKYYKVVKPSGVEGMSFPDLYIVRDGVSRPVTVKEGEYIPTAQIETELFKKSLSVGCLGRALRSGWVKEEIAGNEDNTTEKGNYAIGQIEPGSYAPIDMKKVQAKQKKAKQKRETNTKNTDKYYCPKCDRNHMTDSGIGEKHLKFVTSDEKETSNPTPGTQQFNLKIKNKKEKSNNPNDTQISSQRTSSDQMKAENVNNFEDFQQMLLFSKLKFIQSSSKLNVIKEVWENTDNRQIKSNAQLRLTQEGMI